MEGYGHRVIVHRKKLCTALVIFLLIGETCFLQGKAAPSSQTENDNGLETEYSREETGNPDAEITGTETSEPEETKESVSGSDIPEIKESISGSNIPETKASDQEDTQTNSPDLEKTAKIMCLQLPEKLQIVIDPWEIDGEGQIHSEPFVVKNIGNASGTLTLTFICRMDEKDGVNMKETREGLHDSNQKLIYMKVALGNGEEAAFTREGAQCQAQLQPDEELSLRFEGEVNENAEEPWESGDIEIEGMYIWEKEDEEYASEEDTLSEETDEEAVGEEEISPMEPETETPDKEAVPPTEPTEKETSDGGEILPDKSKEEISEGKEGSSTEPTEEGTIDEEEAPTESEGENTDGKKEPLAEPEKETSDEEEASSIDSEKETRGLSENSL